MKQEPLKIVAFIIVLIGAITYISAVSYGILVIQESKASLILKHVHKQYNQDQQYQAIINEIILDYHYEDYPFRFFEMASRENAKKMNDSSYQKRENQFPILYVHGHKGEYSEIVQILKHLQDVENIMNVNMENRYFKIYVADFREAPSLFSPAIMERQSIFLQKCLQHIKKFSKNPLRVLAHEMGGITILDTISKISKEDINNLREIMFLNVPLSQHPFSIHKSSSDFYQGFYDNLANMPQKLDSVNLISITGGQNDIEVMQHLTQFPQHFVTCCLNNQNYYHFYTQNIKEVHVSLGHREILSYAPFLVQIAKYYILDSLDKIRKQEVDIFFQDHNPKYERILFYKEKNSNGSNNEQQQHQQGDSSSWDGDNNNEQSNGKYGSSRLDLTDPVFRNSCYKKRVGLNYSQQYTLRGDKNNSSNNSNSNRYHCIKFTKSALSQQQEDKQQKPSSNTQPKSANSGTGGSKEFELSIETNIYPENMVIYVIIQNPGQPEYIHILKPQFSSIFQNFYRFPILSQHFYYMVYKANSPSDPRSQLYNTFSQQQFVQTLMSSVSNIRIYAHQRQPINLTENYSFKFAALFSTIELHFQKQNSQMDVYLMNSEYPTLIQSKLCSAPHSAQSQQNQPAFNETINYIQTLQNITVLVIQDEITNQIVYTSLFSNFEDCSHLSTLNFLMKNRKLRLYSTYPITSTYITHDDNAFFSQIGRNQKYSILITAFTYTLIIYLSLYRAHVQIQEPHMQVIHPLQFMLAKIGKLMIFQTLLLLITNFSFDIFICSFLGIGLNGMVMLFFEIYVRISKVIFSRLNVVYGLMFCQILIFFVKKWVVMPLIFSIVVGTYKGKSQNLAFSTFFIAFIIYILNINNIFALFDGGEYNHYIIEYNEGTLDFVFILVWLYYGYQIDHIGNKNKKYMQTGLVCIICIVNFFALEGINQITTLLYPFSVILAFRMVKDIFYDLIKR